MVVASYVMISALLTTAVVANAIFPAVFVAQSPVGINVIAPPPAEIGDGAVMVLIVVVPETKAIEVVGTIVLALATVGADPDNVIVCMADVSCAK